MEITTRPRSRRWQRLASRLALVAAALSLCLLVPGSMGLTQHVVTDGAMGGVMSRGALVFQRPVQSADALRPGDVITFPVPESSYGDLVTRRVVTIDGAHVVTRGDARPRQDPWVLDVEGAGPTRVAFAVPFVGYPALLVPGLTWTVLVFLVALAAAWAAVVARRQSGRDLAVPRLAGPTAPTT